ncbi:MAG: opacity protein-like surface antigen, partial [Bacteroidia bacterium]
VIDPPTMNRTLLIITLVSGLFIGQDAFSQGKLGVFVGGGTMWYAGDLQENPWPHANTIRWTANAGLHWNITRRWGLQLNYTIGELIGSDEFASSQFRQARGLGFQTLIHEIGLRGTFDILPNDKWKVLPYITAGVGALHFEPKQNGNILRELAAERVNYSNWSLAIPTGAGVKWQINCQWALKGEVLYHWTITDYIDDVSTRGNPKWDDGMWDINVGVIYFFTGCGRSKKGGLIEDCEQLYNDVDMDKLMDKYK